MVIVDTAGRLHLDENLMDELIRLKAKAPYKQLKPLIKRHKAEVLIESLRAGDRELMLQYPLIDPRTTSLDQAERMIDEWLAEPRNKAVAERFGV